MAFEYFGDVEQLADLIPVLKKYDLDQLLQYEPFSRTQMADEIRQLCIRFKYDVPLYVIEMLADPNEYTMMALRKGYSPEKPLIDKFNDETGLNVRNPTELADALFEKKTDVTASIETEDDFVRAAFN